MTLNGSRKGELILANSIPLGGFDLLFGHAKLNLKIVEIPCPVS
jgi:hypothetical protein